MNSAPDNYSVGTLASIFEAAVKWTGSNILFSDGNEKYSGKEAKLLVDKLVSSLARLGIGKSMRVAFLVNSSARHMLTFLACQKLGAITCALHVKSTGDQLAEMLEWLDAKWLITDKDNYAFSEKIINSCAKEIKVISLQKVKTEISFESLLEGDAAESVPVDVRPEDPAAIVLSSGTTGAPKGVVHLQSTLYANAISGANVYGIHSSKDSTVVAMAPSYAAWFNVTLPFLAARTKIVFCHSFNPDEFIEILDSQKICIAALPPTMWRMIISSKKSQHNLSNLRIIFFSGEPGGEEFIGSLRSVFPAVEIRTGYLSSEGGTASCCLATDSILKDKPLSTGKPIPGADLRIVNMDGEIGEVMACNTDGEIVVRSLSVAAGYWKDSAMSDAKFVQGWWRTGDIGYIDDDGDVFVTGRIDNVINTGGIKVHAEEVESALLKCPWVRSAAVVGVSDEKWGHSVRAYIVKSENNIDSVDILNFLKSNDLLPSVKLPKSVIFVNELPKGPTGKLYRRGLLLDRR